MTPDKRATLLKVLVVSLLFALVLLDDLTGAQFGSFVVGMVN